MAFNSVLTDLFPFVLKAFTNVKGGKLPCVKRCLQLFIKLIREFFWKPQCPTPSSNESSFNSALLTRIFNISNNNPVHLRTFETHTGYFCSFIPRFRHGIFDILDITVWTIFPHIDAFVIVVVSNVIVICLFMGQTFQTFANITCESR